MLPTLDAIDNLGWVPAPSALESAVPLAADLGLESLWLKRDDALEAFGGGNKLRKLNLLCAEPRLQEADTWHSIGTMGSGHLRACALAARKLRREFIAHSCLQALSRRTVLNLAFTVSHARELYLFRNRVELGVRRPQLFVSDAMHGGAVIASGGSAPAGTVAFTFAAFELVQQLRERDAAFPERVYIPLGSGGAAVGLALGFSLAGVDIEVVGVSVVEHWLLPPGRLAMLESQARGWMREHRLPHASQALRLRIDSAQLGPGYGVPSTASRAASALLQRIGCVSDPVYGGKAMAALLADARRREFRRALFWQTSHRGSTSGIANDWRARLPSDLRQELARHPDLLPQLS